MSTTARARLVWAGTKTEALLVIFCPGCKATHQVTVRSAVPARMWAWNGSVDRPTLQPSLLVRSGHHAQVGDSCWCTWAKDHPDQPQPFKCFRCHSFVEDGRIRFLADSTHAFAGQTVDLSPIEESMGAEQ